MNDLLHTLPDLRVNPDWPRPPLFDRQGWQTVRFGDSVRFLKEQFDPTSGEVDRHVAGEGAIHSMWSWTSPKLAFVSMPPVPLTTSK
jgi:hypothetical protein